MTTLTTSNDLQEWVKAFTVAPFRILGFLFRGLLFVLATLVTIVIIVISFVSPSFRAKVASWVNKSEKK